MFEKKSGLFCFSFSLKRKKQTHHSGRPVRPHLFNGLFCFGN